MDHKYFCLSVCWILGVMAGCAQIEETSAVHVKPTKAFESSDVAIVDKGRYYQVVLNYEHGATPRCIGRAYGEAIVRVIPEYEKNVDAYLADISCAHGSDAYNELIRRAQVLRCNIPQEYREEIEGMAEAFNGQTTNEKNDGKLSIDEVYLMNLVPDIARAHQCSAIGVFGKRSVTGKPIAGRVLDWYSGSNHQLEQLQAVIIVRNLKKSVCLIGYVGFLGCISGFNDDHTFAAILDSPTGEPFSVENKRSYPFDLRYALENQTSLYRVADFMADPGRNYTFNHLIFLADKKRAGVLENNFSGKGAAMKRSLRTDQSPLNAGIEWKFPDAVCAVNAFMLKGNHDNFTGNASNVERWENFRKQLNLAGETVGPDEIKEIISTRVDSNASKCGSIYNACTQQMMVYEPAENELEIFFRPKTGELPARPFFEKVTIDF